MKDKKRRLETYSLYDHTGYEAHLTEMARQGWLLEKIGLLWTYRKIEPKELTFCVCYFAKASQFDPGPSEEQQTFYDFCQHTGWTLAAESAQLQVFCNERPDPVPIETDPVVEVETIHRTMKKTFLLSYFSLLLLGLMYGGMTVWQFTSDPINALCSPSLLFLCLLWPFLLLLTGIELGSYYSWRRKARKAAAQGEFLETKSHPVFQKAALVVLLAVTTWYLAYLLSSGSQVLAMAFLFGMAYVALLLSVFFGVKGLLKRMKASTDTNRVVTFGVYILVVFLCTVLVPVFIMSADWSDISESGLSRNEFPLTLYELTEMPPDMEHSWLTQSPLAGCLDVHQSSHGVDTSRTFIYMDYSVVEVKLSFLYGICKEEMLSRNDTRDSDWDYQRWYEPTDPAPWGAAEAYQQYGKYVEEAYADPDEQYLLCYPDRIVEISFNWEPTPEQIAVAVEKLGRNTAG